MSTPGANIQMISSEVDEATAAMRLSNEEVLTPAVVKAKTKVAETLGTSLVLPETGVVLDDKFTAFIGQLNDLVNTVSKYAHQFDQIKEGLLEMDHKYAQAILNPPQQ
ncbi:hypothetical protein ACFUIW_18370 [Streptomyces sp. NPDC057245]|uniref:hypothetical protein n=1 Tax=Streptomyces TaxID=1883 RepID=UPI001C1E6174|nr:hypothetical protein [Streptomyces sp. A108]MBU6533449.1 hypothetical protein [Streptomyces sp. A108]